MQYEDERHEFSFGLLFADVTFCFPFTFVSYCLRVYSTTGQCNTIFMKLNPLHIRLYCLYQCSRATAHFRIATLLPRCILQSNTLGWIALHYTLLPSRQSGFGRVWLKDNWLPPVIG